MQQNDFVYDHILIRYGELSTKGKNRKDFIRRLYTNVKHALNMFEAIEIRHQFVLVCCTGRQRYREDQKCGAGAGIKKSGQNLQGRYPPQLETVSDDF